MNPYDQPQGYGLPKVNPQPQMYGQPMYGPQGYAQQQPNTYQQYQQPFPTQSVQRPIDQAKIDADSATLRKAMKGLGTDEKEIIQLVSTRTNRERLAMIDSYKKQINREI